MLAALGIDVARARTDAGYMEALRAAISGVALPPPPLQVLPPPPAAAPPADEALAGVQALLARGEAVPQQVLMDACEHNRLAVVEFLLASGVSMRANDDDAFVMAATEGHAELCRLLLERGGADINAQAGCALINTAYYAEEHVLRLLLDRGADVPVYGGDAVLKAAEAGHVHIVELLFQRGADSSLQHEASRLLAGEDVEDEEGVAVPQGPRHLLVTTFSGTLAVLGNIAKMAADSTVCSTCLGTREQAGDELTKEFVVTRCGHAFHRSCLAMWVRTKPTCPDCRARIVCACQPLKKKCNGSCVGMKSKAQALGRTVEVPPP